MLPLLPPLVAAAAALKVVDEKPQELTTSSTSVDTGSLLAEDHLLLPVSLSRVESELYVPFCSSSSSSN
jgi:hypothetical protein